MLRLILVALVGLIGCNHRQVAKRVRVPELQREYEVDPEEAGAKHRAKRYFFRAEVLATEADPSGPLRVAALVSTPDNLTSVVCAMSKGQERAAVTLRYGDKVLLEGTPAEAKSGNMLFADCMVKGSP